MRLGLANRPCVTSMTSAGSLSNQSPPVMLQLAGGRGMADRAVKHKGQAVDASRLGAEIWQCQWNGPSVAKQKERASTRGKWQKRQKSAVPITRDSTATGSANRPATSPRERIAVSPRSIEADI